MFVCLFVCLLSRLVSSRLGLCWVVLGWIVLSCLVLSCLLISFVYFLQSFFPISFFTWLWSEGRFQHQKRINSRCWTRLLVCWLTASNPSTPRSEVSSVGWYEAPDPIALRYGVVWLGQRSTNMAVKGLEMKCAKTWSLHIVFLVTGFNSVSSLSELDHQNAPPLPGEQCSCHGQALVQTAQEICPRRS